MNIEKCRTCKNYDDFFGVCLLYKKETYLGEGEFDYTYYKISEITKEECEYERRL